MKVGILRGGHPPLSLRQPRLRVPQRPSAVDIISICTLVRGRRSMGFSGKRGPAIGGELVVPASTEAKPCPPVGVFGLSRVSER